MGLHRFAFVETDSPAGSTLGQRIRNQRLNLFMTQSDLAEALKAAGTPVEQSNISRWEADATVPALRYRPTLAQVLRIAPHILYDGIQAAAS